MQYPFGVDIGYSVEYFLDDNFDLFLIDFIIFASDILFEVKIIEVKYYFEQLFFRFVEHINQRYDVGVLLERLEQRDLSECAGWYSFFFALEFDVLDCNKFIVFVDGFVDFAERPFSDGADLLKLLMRFHQIIYYTKLHNK